MKWQDKLGKKDMKHLHENGITTLRGVKECHAHQQALETKWSTPEHRYHACYDCRKIQDKLGMK